VTPPISTNLPTKREEQVTATLMVELKKQNTFESEEEARTRYDLTIFYFHTR
jgi:poly(A) polymerase